MFGVTVFEKHFIYYICMFGDDYEGVLIFELLVELVGQVTCFETMFGCEEKVFMFDEQKVFL